MKVYHSLEGVPEASGPSSIAIGNFDGVHLGHQALLTAMLEQAKLRGVLATVVTFFPHPAEVLNPDRPVERLSSPEEKLSLLEEMGVDRVLVIPFSRDIAAMEPETFYQNFLRSRLCAVSIHVGFNFRFGRNRRGTTDLLKELGAKESVDVMVQPPFEVANERVSSTLIRNLIRSGKVDEVLPYLGRPYSLSSQVVRGDGRGRQLGYPTANLKPRPGKILPKLGVYAARGVWQKQAFFAAANLGIRPTIAQGASSVALEVHLLDFEAQLYGELIRVEFLKRVRDEMKFASVEELKSQIARDVKWIRESINQE